MNSPPLLLPPPLVINRDRVRTIAAAPLPPRSVKIALCKNQAARVGCCVFFVFLSLVFFWSVGKKRSFPKEFFLYLNVKFYVGISGINRGNFVRHRSIRTESTWYIFTVHTDTDDDDDTLIFISIGWWWLRLTVSVINFSNLRTVIF